MNLTTSLVDGTAVIQVNEARLTSPMLSDFAAGIREGYVGLDNRKVGRTAAWMISKAAKRPGKVALFVGSHRFHGHELREIGFRSFFREQAPDFTLLETLVNLEANQITQDYLDAYADGFNQYIRDLQHITMASRKTHLLKKVQS